MTKRFLQALRQISWSPLICFGLALLLAQTGPFKQLEWRSLDWRTRMRALVQGPPDPRIEIILYEDSTDGASNALSWPPDRAWHAELMELLTLAKPALLVWDVVFDTVRETGDGDVRMGRAAAGAMKAGMPVVSGAILSDAAHGAKPAGDGPTQSLVKVEGDTGRLLGAEALVLPFAKLREVSLYGTVDAPRDGDGIIREIPLVVRVGDKIFPSLALQSVMAYHGAQAGSVRVKLGDAVYVPAGKGQLRIPISDTGRFLLNYRYDHAAERFDFPTDTYLGLLRKLNARWVEKTPGADPAGHWEGKILLVGQAVTGKADAGPTPRSPYSPLVMMQANALNSMLTGDYARRLPDWIAWAALLLAGYGGTMLLLKRPIEKMILAALLVGGAFSALSALSWIWWSLWVPWTGPMLGYVCLQFVMIASRVLLEKKAREHVEQMFGKYLGPKLLHKMVREKRFEKLKPERRAVTVLFTDLRDFTHLSEITPGDRLMAQLNEYLEAMVECIFAHDGTLHKFIGDAVMAVWGDLATAGAAEDAEKAVQCAQMMQARLTQLNERWMAQGMPQLRMGIGLNHGEVLVGNVGCEQRMEFTVIGSAVNQASRFERLNKEMGTGIIMGPAIVGLLGRRETFHSLGSIQIKGVAGSVEIFEVRNKGA